MLKEKELLEEKEDKNIDELLVILKDIYYIPYSEEIYYIFCRMRYEGREKEAIELIEYFKVFLNPKSALGVVLCAVSEGDRDLKNIYNILSKHLREKEVTVIFQKLLENKNLDCFNWLFDTYTISTKHGLKVVLAALADYGDEVLFQQSLGKINQQIMNGVVCADVIRHCIKKRCSKLLRLMLSRYSSLVGDSKYIAAIIKDAIVHGMEDVAWELIDAYHHCTNAMPQLYVTAVEEGRTDLAKKILNTTFDKSSYGLFLYKVEWIMSSLSDVKADEQLKEFIEKIEDLVDIPSMIQGDFISRFCQGLIVIGSIEKFRKLDKASLSPKHIASIIGKLISCQRFGIVDEYIALLDLKLKEPTPINMRENGSDVYMREHIARPILLGFFKLPERVVREKAALWDTLFAKYGSVFENDELLSLAESAMSSNNDWLSLKIVNSITEDVGQEAYAYIIRESLILGKLDLAYTFIMKSKIYTNSTLCEKFEISIELTHKYDDMQKLLLCQPLSFWVVYGAIDTKHKDGLRLLKECYETLDKEERLLLALLAIKKDNIECAKFLMSRCLLKCSYEERYQILRDIYYSNSTELDIYIPQLCSSHLNVLRCIIDEGDEGLFLQCIEYYKNEGNGLVELLPNVIKARSCRMFLIIKDIAKPILSSQAVYSLLKEAIILGDFTLFSYIFKQDGNVLTPKALRYILELLEDSRISPPTMIFTEVLRKCDEEFMKKYYKRLFRHSIGEVGNLRFLKAILEVYGDKFAESDWRQLLNSILRTPRTLNHLCIVGNHIEALVELILSKYTPTAQTIIWMVKVVLTKDQIIKKDKLHIVKIVAKYKELLTRKEVILLFNIALETQTDLLAKYILSNCYMYMEWSEIISAAQKHKKGAVLLDFINKFTVARLNLHQYKQAIELSLDMCWFAILEILVAEGIKHSKLSHLLLYRSYYALYNIKGFRERFKGYIDDSIQLGPNAFFLRGVGETNISKSAAALEVQLCGKNISKIFGIPLLYKLLKKNVGNQHQGSVSNIVFAHFDNLRYVDEWPDPTPFIYIEVMYNKHAYKKPLKEAMCSFVALYGYTSPTVERMFACQNILKSTAAPREKKAVLEEIEKLAHVLSRMPTSCDLPRAYKVLLALNLYYQCSVVSHQNKCKLLCSSTCNTYKVLEHTIMRGILETFEMGHYYQVCLFTYVKHKMGWATIMHPFLIFLKDHKKIAMFDPCYGMYEAATSASLINQINCTMMEQYKPVAIEIIDLSRLLVLDKNNQLCYGIKKSMLL